MVSCTGQQAWRESGFDVKLGEQLLQETYLKRWQKQQRSEGLRLQVGGWAVGPAGMSFVFLLVMAFTFSNKAPCGAFRRSWPGWLGAAAASPSWRLWCVRRRSTWHLPHCPQVS